jgi:hypothetical protein
MTSVERGLLKIKDPNDLKLGYDTLKTTYDQRYFLNALPGYFADKKIQTVPGWVKNAVIDGIGSRDPLLVNEAVRVAGALKINCSGELMSLYKNVKSTYGCNEEMLKTTILNSLSTMDNPKKQWFFYDLLTKEDVPVLSSSFEALLDAMVTSRSQAYDQKLGEYSYKLSSLKSKYQTGKEHDYRFKKCQYLAEKIENLRGRIARDNSENQKGGKQ